MATSFFTQADCPQLLLGENVAGDAGFVVAVLPAAVTGSGNSYAIADVLTSAQLGASIVFTQQAVGATAAAQQQFVNAVLALIPAPATNRFIAWIPNPAAMPATLSVPYVLLAGGGSSVTTSSPLYMAVGATLGMTVSAPQTLTASADAVSMSGALPSFSGPSALSSGQILQQPLVVPFSGPSRGCVQFSLYTPQSSLNWSFVFGSPGLVLTPPSPPRTLCAPLASADPKQNSGFDATFDPLDPNAVGNRNALVFMGTNLDGSTTTLLSYYTTAVGGTAVTLTPVIAPGATGDVPAQLVFAYPTTTVAVQQYLALQPSGDFIIGLSGGATQAQLLCGLQGAEYLVVQAGDRIRYTSGQPAFVPTFPFPISSPVSPPFDPTVSPLTPAWTTAWATVRPPGGSAASVVAVAQPPGFNLFGQDQTIHTAYPNLLGHADPGTLLPADPQQPFPLVPYAGVAPGSNGTTFTTAQVVQFETQVLGPARHAAIVVNEQGSSRVLSAQNRLLRRNAAQTGSVVCPDGSTAVNVTTPSGYLVTLCETQTTTTWAQILLAKLLGPPEQDLAFVSPDATLEQAFQTGQLMLVIANAQHTGDFENELTIGEWGMAADVGTGQNYGDYANIVIVKAMPGALYDPAATDPTTNLVGNPSKWTMAGDFAAPTVGGGTTPDATQLPNLALWLQDYFAAAFAEDAADPTYFDSFCTLAKDPNWTGVLVLRGTIAAVPEGIAGITAGVTDPALFNVHHLAVPLTPIANTSGGPQVLQSSSVSGLIYYIDPSAVPANPSAPLPTDPSETYAFRLLSLKVLFEGSALKAFSSYVQITLRSFFGSDATSASTYDSIVLSGSYQIVDGQPIYSMASVADSPFALANDVLQRVEVTGVQMSTVSADPTGNTVSAFTLGGYLDFAVVPGTSYTSADPKNPQAVDLFGFGNAPGASVSRQGLAFQALTLQMTFPTLTPAQPPAFVLQTDPMRFDLGNSTLRTASMVNEFNLQLTSYTWTDATPASLGFLPVVAMIPAGDLSGGWNGLVFRIDLGTPGNLAAKAGLSSSLLLAWSPDSPGSGGTSSVQVGLQLPGTAQGAPLISLQNVLKLSIGQVALTYTATADKSRYGFLLMLNEIAMMFLGLLKIPPNGATSFYLFGDPNGANALGWYAIYNNEPTTTTSALTSA